MAFKETGRPLQGSPIPKLVSPDSSEYAPPYKELQGHRLARLYALTYTTAATIAGLAYGVAQ